MRVVVLLGIMACTHASAPAPAIQARAPSKCPRLDVEQVVPLPDEATNMRMIVDGAGVAHVVWATYPRLSEQRPTLRFAYHHAQEVNGRWQRDDHGLPSDVQPSTFEVALAPDGKSIVVAIPDTADHGPRHFTLYAGPPWKAIGGLTASGLSLTYDGTNTYAAAFGKGRLAIHRVTADRVEEAALVTLDVPELAHNVRVSMTNEGLAVDLDDYETPTDKEKPLRITNLEGQPTTREVEVGGIERGPHLEGDADFTFVKNAGKRILISRYREDLHACGPDCERRPPASFTSRLEWMSSKLAVRANDMVVVGMAWTTTGSLKEMLPPTDSSASVWYERHGIGSGVLVAARTDGVHSVVIDETSLHLRRKVTVDSVAVDPRGRVHALIRYTQFDDHFPEPRYVRLGCKP